MALKIDTNFKGIAISGAYVRVVYPSIRLDKSSMDFTVQYRASASDPAFQAAQVEGAPYDIDGSNPLCQAYNYLKTLPEFSGAQDLLEDGLSS